MAADHVGTGAKGEDAAAAWYEAAGFAVVDRNWRCPVGELDLVAHRAGGPGAPAVLAVVEVKARRGDRYGSPADALTPAKRRRVRRAAAAWLATHRRAGGWGDVRFDLAAVTWPSPGAGGPGPRSGRGRGPGGGVVEVFEDAF